MVVQFDLPSLPAAGCSGTPQRDQRHFWRMLRFVRCGKAGFDHGDDMEVTLTINGEPCGMPRARATAFQGRARMFTPTSVKDSAGNRKPHPAAEFKAAIKQAWTGELATELPVEVLIEAIFPRPKQKVWKTRPMPRYAHTSKPDGDNIGKAVLDALNGLAYRDDSQVYDVRIVKMVAAGDENPHTRITIRAVGDVQ